MRSSAVVIALVALVACGGETTLRHQHDLRISVRDDRGEPLEGVTVTLDARDVGETDAGGELGISLSAPDGQRIDIDAACPDGHDPPADDGEILLRPMHGAAPSSTVELDLVITCPRRERLTVLVVRADGPAGIPVHINGEQRARTDASGAAHVVLRRAPGTSFAAELDTSDHPELKPQNPRFVFAIADEDQFVIFDQLFSTPRKKRRRKAPLLVDMPARPIRID